MCNACGAMAMTARRNDRFTVSRPAQHFSVQPFAGTESHDREIRSHRVDQNKILGCTVGAAAAQ